MFYFLKNGANFLKRRQEDVLSAAFVIAFSVALSRILGLVRYRLLASYFGDNIQLLDSFIAASILPEAIFEVLIFGTIALAFIPVFSQYLSREKLEKAWRLSSTMITLGLFAFAVLAILILALANFIAPIIAPGLISKDPLALPLIARLLRIMILAQFFFVISIFLVPVFGIYAPAIGMILGALLHLVIQLPLALSLGFKFRPNLDIGNKDVRQTIALMWPRSIALGLIRISDMINIALASIATVGSIVAFNFAQ